MKRLVFVFFSLFSLSCNTLSSSYTGSEEVTKPRNVVFFISDGCGQASFDLAREYQKSAGAGSTLFLDTFQTGSVITFSANSRITDSAASGTAFACAIKTYNGAIGVDVNKQSVENVLEMAEKAGFQTGLISTTRITHATPAAFSSHVELRAMEAEIASQQILQGIEILMGGGRLFYIPQEESGARTDGRNILDEAVDAGYHRVDNAAEMEKASDLPLIGLFTLSHMAYEIDRDDSLEPSLADMTAKALELLSASEDPFFIMIEAGRIDHAAHGNDAAAHLQDVLAYDAAIKVAVGFARRDGRTLVFGTSDHETGGLTLGAQYPGLSGYGYDPSKLRGISSSIEKLLIDLQAELASEGTDISGWIEKEVEARFNLNSAGIGIEIRKLVQYREVTGDSAAWSHLRLMLVDSTSAPARVGWSTGGHTAANVPIFAYGPGSSFFGGTMDNTEVGRALRAVLGLE